MFHLPKLPYAFDALEPNISEETLKYHYGKHHKGYVDKLNELTADGGEYTLEPGASLEDLMAQKTWGGIPSWGGLDIEVENPKIQGYAAQHWNHTFYWLCMTPNYQKPNPLKFNVVKQIEKIDSMADFEKNFVEIGKNRLGSGWIWLYISDDRLVLEAQPDFHNPVINGDIPLMTCDIWEHAYYLDYFDDRGEYLDVFFNKLLNWDFVEKQFNLHQRTLQKIIYQV